jgi:hypothetical protein
MAREARAHEIGSKLNLISGMHKEGNTAITLLRASVSEAEECYSCYDDKSKPGDADAS